jgi:hypothetical protein
MPAPMTSAVSPPFISDGDAVERDGDGFEHGGIGKESSSGSGRRCARAR